LTGCKYKKKLYRVKLTSKEALMWIKKCLKLYF